MTEKEMLSESMRYLANRRWAQLTADERAASTEPARLARLKKRHKKVKQGEGKSG